MKGRSRGRVAKWDINFIRVDAEKRFWTSWPVFPIRKQSARSSVRNLSAFFEEEGKKIGKVDYLVQGTIYPDVIESGAGDAAVIKSHHNVGGLPDFVDFKGNHRAAACCSRMKCAVSAESWDFRNIS